ncbi:MAG TPA: hypothetical protein DGP36_05105, partial [Ruminococcus sp.]|nr:hypothetical protein [Ruminococcus sp.]
MVLLLFLLSVLFSIIPKKAERCKSRTQIIGKIDFQREDRQILLQKTAVELAQLGGGGLLRGTSCNVINLKRLLNGKQNVWKYQNGEEKSDSDG